MSGPYSNKNIESCMFSFSTSSNALKGTYYEYTIVFFKTGNNFLKMMVFSLYLHVLMGLLWSDLKEIFNVIFAKSTLFANSKTKTCS